jgi:hypothetical protein
MAVNGRMSGQLILCLLTDDFPNTRGDRQFQYLISALQPVSGRQLVKSDLPEQFTQKRRTQGSRILRCSTSRRFCCDTIAASFSLHASIETGSSKSVQAVATLCLYTSAAPLRPPMLILINSSICLWTKSLFSDARSSGFTKPLPFGH